MKLFFQTCLLLFLHFAAVSVCSAQRNYYEEDFTSNVSELTTSSDDTLGFYQFFNSGNHLTVYGVNGGSGYIVGNNNFGDKQKAQRYNSSQGVYIKKIIFLFGRKQINSGNQDSKIEARVYNLDGTGSSSAGSVSAPGTVVASVNINIADIDTSGNFTIAEFQNPVFVTGDFAVGFSVTSLANGDYVGCVSTLNGERVQADYSWEQWDSNQWATLFLQASNGGWELDIDLAIFPVTSVTASVADKIDTGNLKLYQNQPNPANAETLINYEIQNSSNIVFEIYDLVGKKILSMNEGNKSKGKHTISVSTEKISAGTYYYTLKMDNYTATEKMIIAR